MRLPEEGCKLEELLAFVYRIYQSTGGSYPLLEWVEKKPAVDNRAAFETIYRPFLKARMKQEFDALYVWRNGGGALIATVALVHRLKGKTIEWFPPHLMTHDAALIEFLMVAPDHQRKGYGKAVLAYALERLHAMGKRAYVATSPHLSAHDFYRAHGFRDVCRHNKFTIMVHD